VALLSLSGIVKRFGAIEAVAGVDFQIEPGEVVGLMGDNGAGKSTLVKMIAGNFPPDAGTIKVEGRPVRFHKPVEARSMGIEVVYQDLALCDNLTASDNVFLGRERWRLAFGFIPVLNYRGMRERSRALFEELKSETRAGDPVRRMSGGQRQAVAIARTRLAQAKIILMDEPTAAISVRQVKEVLDLIHRLKEQNIAVILISHRMPDVFAVCDRIVVMRRGRKVADKPIADTSPEEVTGLITGAIHSA
jgi:simple sugar transport system ATP-binding protein